MTATFDRQRSVEEMVMWKRAGLTVAAGLAVVTMGCAQRQPEAVMVVEDRVYAVTPASIDVQTGIMKGQLTDMKVTERVEKESGKVVSPAKLSGKLMLTNSSADQTVRLIEGQIRFVDGKGEPIKAEEKRIQSTTVKFSGYGATERLDPGQSATQSVDVDVPADALKANALKEVQLDLVYLPSSFRQERMRLPMTLGAAAAAP
jgi:hypothetical protein